MSEMQLQKIEELTLHIIEMNKKVNELSKTVETQQEQIKKLEKK
jgi:outer membrane murein-binding lipoprotein Lpp